MKTKFSNKLAKEIAKKQYNWVIGGILQDSDMDYTLFSDLQGDGIVQNFEEALEELEIFPSCKRIEIISNYYNNMIECAILKIKALYKD